MIAPIRLPRVLVIDDEIGPRESLRILLKNEFDVTCADSVAQGLEALDGANMDLVIMDIRMPGCNGIEGLKRIRTIDSNVSVVMLTGYCSLDTAQQALRLGANDYLNKPFDTDDMRRLVHRYTQRSRFERRRNRMLSELEDVNARLLRDLAHREQMASIGESSTEFAHDLRNPLMIVSGYVELLSKKLKQRDDLASGNPEDIQEYLDIIGSSIERCCDLAQMWQKLGRTDMMKCAPVSLGQVIEDLMLSAEPLAASEKVELTYEVETRGVRINACRPQLVRALHNLVANAVQAVAPGSGRVDVHVVCDEQAQEAKIAVEDNGTGMTEAVLQRLFDPYFTTKPEGEGTGLGTVIVKKIVEEHNGVIDVSSAPGEGTRISIKLPTLPAETPAPSPWVGAVQPA